MIAMEKKSQAAQGVGRAPWGMQGMQVAGSKWVIRMGDAEKVSSLWTQTLRWTWPGVFQKLPRGQGGYRRRESGEEGGAVRAAGGGQVYRWRP